MKNIKYYVFIILSLSIELYAQSIQEMQKMKSEYDRMKLMEPSRQQTSTQNSTINNPLNSLPALANIISYNDKQTDSLKILNKYYGYNFFTKRDTVSFWENLPTPPDYLLGPGDEIVISLWGETQFRSSLTISREGTIYNDKVGLLYLMGKTLEESRIYLLNQFSQVYATLNTPTPTTFIDVSLGRLRSINVNFVGEVPFPGVYPLHPFSNLITGLIQSGGVDTTGSLRNIKIKRGNDVIKSIDLYDYFLKGNIPNNIQLRDQDIILVPARKSFVNVDSAVIRPGIYESIPGESISQIIDYAGGLRYDASSTISLNRITPFFNRKDSLPSIESYYIDYKNSNLTIAQNGDLIIVRPILKSLAQVEIIGQVKNPGLYNYYPGMTVMNLLDLSSGFSDSTFWKSVFQSRAEIVRRNPKERYESVIEVNLIELMNRKSGSNIELQNLDRFVVHANLNFFEKNNVKISGEVNIPGSYPLITDDETLKSLIVRAGGITTQALNNGISIFRDRQYYIDVNNKEITIENETTNNEEVEEISKIRIAYKDENIMLMPGDSIIVKEATYTVNVVGAVYNPGLIEYQKGKSLRYYINSAGGLKDEANKGGIIVLYANGSIKPKNLFFINPKVEDGATIIINQKIVDAPFDMTQFATNWTSIITSMITAIILSKQLSAG